jgi:hypothetical protein
MGMKRWVRWGLVLGLILALGLAPLAAQATERGLAAYPDGAENFFAGAFPPPGFYLQDYLLIYNAPMLRGNVPPNSSAEAVFNVLRFIYSSKVEILGANWGAHIIFPIGYLGLAMPAINFSDYQFGVGNWSIDPFILGWHFGEFHITTGMDIIFPGTYNHNNAASPSQNYFTFQPVLGLAWMPKSGFGVNIKMMYDFPTENSDPIAITGANSTYQSGQAFHFDYCIDYAVMPSLRVGAAGFYYVQTTADSADGRTIGNHGRQFALGPAIKYDYQRFSFMFIPQFEMATLNRPEGQRYWFKAWYAF